MIATAIFTAVIQLVDVTSQSGAYFRHETGATGEKYMTETMGSGVVFFDYDADGDADLLFVNGGDPTGRRASSTSAATLYRNDGHGSFTDVSLAAGLEHIGYGMGATAGDYDNDGDADLYVTHYGPNFLFRNDGDGTFSDVTTEAGVGNAQWSASATWADFDNDGHLDLYVTNYLDFSLTNNPNCSQRRDGNVIRAYCLPDAFRGVPDELYRNRGDGTFESAGSRAGIALPSGKGLGVVSLDYDHDGLLDLYIANDTMPNFFFRNRGDLAFEELGLIAGVSYDADGNALAGMGVDRSDYDRDSDLDLFVTNFEGEANTLYRNEANGFFTDIAMRSGIGRPSLRRLGFGAVFADLDNDGLDDLIVANGHVLDNADVLQGSDYAQPNQVYHNDGGGIFSVSDLDAVGVSRGLAVADWDGDLDLDLVISSSGGAPELLRNDTEGGASLRIRLVGRQTNRDGIGTVIKVGSRRFESAAATSYLSQSENVVHIGLGDEGSIEEIHVTWPGGHEERRGPFDAGTTVLWVESVQQPDQY